MPNLKVARDKHMYKSKPSSETQPADSNEWLSFQWSHNVMKYLYKYL